MRQRTRNALLAAAAGLLLCGAGREDRGLAVCFIDVQGGAATLVVTPERESVLIDSGWKTPDDRDPKRIEHVVKTVAGLDHIDHLVTTHWDEDHYGGVGGLARRVRIDHFWDRGLPDPDAPKNKTAFPNGPDPDDPLGAAYRDASRGKRKTLKAGDKLPLKGDVEAVVLAAGGKIVEAPTGPGNPNCAGTASDPKPEPTENAKSVVLRFRAGKFEFLAGGDLSGEAERALVCPTDRVGPIDLFQATHHGTALSNTTELLRTIAPTVVVINNGPGKGADPTTMRRLKTIPSIKATYQIHKNVATDESINAEPDRVANAKPSGGQFLRASVSPDGGKFRVQVGDDGPAGEFESH